MTEPNKLTLKTLEKRIARLEFDAAATRSDKLHWRPVSNTVSVQIHGHGRGFTESFDVRTVVQALADKGKLTCDSTRERCIR